MVRPLYPDVATLLRHEMAQLMIESQYNVFETLEPKHRSVLINAIELKESAIDIEKFDKFQIEDDYQELTHIFRTIHEIKDEISSSPELSRSYIAKIIHFIKSILVKFFHKEIPTLIADQGSSIQALIDKNKTELKEFVKNLEAIEKRLWETDGLTNSPEYETIKKEREILLKTKQRHTLRMPNIEISLSQLKKFLEKDEINNPEPPMNVQEQSLIENVTPGED